MLVSLLTATVGYTITSTILLSLALITLVSEFWWIEVVYRRFPVLTSNQARQTDDESSPVATLSSSEARSRGAVGWFERERKDWAEFIRLPIFFSTSRSCSAHGRGLTKWQVQRPSLPSTSPRSHTVSLAPLLYTRD